MFGRMEQHPTPNIKGFFLVIWDDWGSLMSGIFTVPFTIAALFAPSEYRAIFAVMAILAFALTAYRVWSDERMRVIGLEQHLSPRLRIEFDPHASKFVSPTTASGINMRYIRVIARALSPVVRDCRAYLERISYWDGETYVTLFDEQLPMPWSNQDPNNFHVPKELNHDVDALLDVAWLAEPTPPGFVSAIPPFGILNHGSNVPNSFDPKLLWILQNPTRNLKLDILVTAKDSESARLSLNIHRGASQWDQAQIGWMKGLEIVINKSNYSTDLTPAAELV
jgi:hypothetical protein